jgi:hypothetical protein
MKEHVSHRKENDISKALQLVIENYYYSYYVTSRVAFHRVML